MFKNYFKIIARKLLRNKIYTIFSIVSLTIGLACSIFAYFYVTHELSYDSFFKHSERIVRVEYQSYLKEGGTKIDYAILPGHNLKPQVFSRASIQQKTRLVRLPELFVGLKEGEKITENYGFAADTKFFDVFDFRIIAGNKRHPLDKPNSIVLTRKTAQKYFGHENAIGKKLTIITRRKELPLTVSAVMENIPANSHLKFNFLITAPAFKNMFDVDISESYVAYQYLLLAKNTNINELEKNLSNVKLKWENGKFRTISYTLTPITDIHLNGSSRYSLKPGSNIRYVYYFLAIAVLVLIISCINYISLFLSESEYRYKQIGIRKVFGAQKFQLVFQLHMEAVFLGLISFIIALLVAYLALPLFNELTGISFTPVDFISAGILWKGLIFSIVIGVISGLYPAMVILAKGKKYSIRSSSTAGTKKSLLQNLIVVTQFTASIILIIGTLVIYGQMNYIRQKDLGFNAQNIITTPNLLRDDAGLFKQLLSDNPNIENVTISSYVPGVSETGGTALVKALSTGKEITANWISVDYNYFKTFSIPLVEGRYFSKEYATDSTKAFILNKAAVKVLGLQHPMGKQLNAFARTGNIVGVVQDFNYLSLHQQIPPMVFLMMDNLYFSISIKLAETANIPVILNQVEEAWVKIAPNVPFNYTFLQDKMARLYENERTMGRSILSFSIIALIVSCLGLFSIAAYNMRKRTKEIGIRKVLGATGRNILALIYSKFFKLVLIANLIAIPVAYVLVRNWLANFAYKMDISAIPFLVAFILTSFLTIIALGYWALKAAWLNPVESIKTE